MTASLEKNKKSPQDRVRPPPENETSPRVRAKFQVLVDHVADGPLVIAQRPQDQRRVSGAGPSSCHGEQLVGLRAIQVLLDHRPGRTELEQDVVALVRPALVLDDRPLAVPLDAADAPAEHVVVIADRAERDPVGRFSLDPNQATDVVVVVTCHVAGDQVRGGGAVAVGVVVEPTSAVGPEQVRFPGLVAGVGPVADVVVAVGLVGLLLVVGSDQLAEVVVAVEGLFPTSVVKEPSIGSDPNRRNPFQRPAERAR